MRLLLTVALVCALFVLINNAPLTKPVQYEAPVVPIEPSTVAEEEEVVLRSELKPICACESVGNPNEEPRQFNADGSVIRGRIDPDDTGMCQINKRYWLAKAQSLGYDIETEQGNIQMANWIYDQSGTQPWKWSKPCWSKT